MGLFDKLKNALFEEEYVEVEEKPKKIKKDKPKKETEKKEKPVAKKVILPGKKNVKVEELHEEELIDEDFEIRPKVEEVIEEDKDELLEKPKREEFRVMDDDDFKVDDEIIDDSSRYDEPEIVQVIGRRHNNFLDDYDEDEDKEEVEVEEQNNDYERDLNDGKHLYGMSEPEVKVQDYGLYEKKEEKGYFKPSPIISPIYGILDKNYRKEDVVSKKDVRVVSSYSRKRVDIDDVRNKAYGTLSDDFAKEFAEPEKEDNSFEVSDDDEKRLVDLSKDENKPTVKEVTVGDAVEYFQDLGLEYNVDYVDASKETSPKRRSRVEENADVAEAIEEERKNEEDAALEEKPVVKKEKKVVAVAKVETVEPVKDNEDSLLDTNDNLFDLIDSMYQENE